MAPNIKLVTNQPPKGIAMITAELLREWGACWPDWQIRERMGTRESVTPRDVAADESISLDDRLWVLCRCIWYLDEHAARMFAIESAATVVHLAGDERDQEQYLGILNWLLEIEDLPEDARAAARDAARDAALGAARTAARDAVWGAALAATRDAARDAVWGAALAATRDAAWIAARAATRNAAWIAARAAARDEHIRSSISRALHWLGDYADGWIEDDEQIQEGIRLTNHRKE